MLKLSKLLNIGDAARNLIRPLGKVLLFLKDKSILKRVYPKLDISLLNNLIQNYVRLHRLEFQRHIKLR